MKVDFLIAGTQNGGTSALDTYLRAHPDICMANRKEVHFFDNEGFFSDGQPNYARYHSYFPDVSDSTNTRVGEATPIYMYWHEAPRRIHEYNPGIKLIISLRNPITRAFSHWNMVHSRQEDDASLWEALQLAQARRKAAFPLQPRQLAYIDRGFYVAQLERIFRYFPRSQVLILRSADIRHDPQRILDQIFQFLDVPGMEIKEKALKNIGTYPTPMRLREWRYLRQVFEPEIRSLERLLDWNCDAWLAQPADIVA